VISRVGKEGNRIEDREVGLVIDVEAYEVHYEYRERDVWVKLVVPALRTIPRSELVEACELDRGTVRRALAEHEPTRPHASNEARLTAIAAAYAHSSLVDHGVTPTGNLESDLYRYLEIIDALKEEDES
jgi:hypothetical protein